MTLGEKNLLNKTGEEENGFSWPFLLSPFVSQPISRQQIFIDRSKLKPSADDSFKFDENSRKFSKHVENTVGKGEIARYEQFLLCPQCFQKACFPGASKGVIVWEWVKQLLKSLPKQQNVERAKCIIICRQQIHCC